MNPADLEQMIDRKLKQLQVLRAPHTLLPRVLAAVQEWSLRPWYRRAWFTWPLAGQVAAIAVVVLSASGGAFLLSAARAAATGATSTLAVNVMSRIALVAEGAGMTTAAGRILWGTLIEPLLPYAFALVMVMCLACATFGAVLNRVAFGRT
jgi:hypothetical protein